MWPPTLGDVRAWSPQRHLWVGDGRQRHQDQKEGISRQPRRYWQKRVAKAFQVGAGLWSVGWRPGAGPGSLASASDRRAPSAGDGGGAVLPAPVRHQAADQQGLHRRHHRQGPLHAQRGVAAAGEHRGQAPGEPGGRAGRGPAPPESPGSTAARPPPPPAGCLPSRARWLPADPPPLSCRI